MTQVETDTRVEVTTTVGLDAAPAPIRALTTLSRVDYVDVFSAPTARARHKSPERWARDFLEVAPFSRRNAPPLWRALGLRLGPTPSAEHIQGWKIGGCGDDWIRVATSSWYMSGQAVLRVDDDRITVALFLRFDHPFGRLMWLVVGPGHRRGVPVMLRQALRVP